MFWFDIAEVKAQYAQLGIPKQICVFNMLVFQHLVRLAPLNNNGNTSVSASRKRWVCQCTALPI